METIDSRPLRVMFLDLNSYFASVQQAERPELRGKPVGVCAVQADSSFLIAASYEAKAFGVKTGTRIGDAKRMCPGLILVSGGHRIYSQYHDRILDAVETVLPIDRVCSIDEMQFRLIGKEQQPDEAEKLAMRMKKAIWEQVSPAIHCSIGVAPNGFLAKLATDLQKPNGLVFIHGHELPDRLAPLGLTEFTGINRRMEARLNAKGIFSAADLIKLSRTELTAAFGSIWGERWWYLLRGYELETKTGENQSLGHSHVLPPDLRTDQGAREVMLRLIQKASARLRASGLYASSLSLHVRGIRRSWDAHTRLSPTHDSVRINSEAMRLWEKRDFDVPTQVGLTFRELLPLEQVTFSLFEEGQPDNERLNQAVDVINHKFGKNTIYIAGMHQAKDTAEERIAFQKTSLFDEGGEKSHRKRKSPFRRA